MFPEGIMADEIEIINKFYEIARTPQQLNFFCETPEHARKIAEHKTWLNNIRHECPSPAVTLLPEKHTL